MKTILTTFGPTALLLSALLIGIFPQSAADPQMMLPFALISGFLILSGNLLRIPSNDIILLLLICLWALWTASGLHSIIPFPSKVTWVLMGTLPVSYILARTLPDKNPLQILPVICLPFAAYTIWQGLHGISRPNDPFDDSNLLGLLYAFGILSALPKTLPDQKKIIRILSAGIALVLLGALVITQSRSALIALACSGFIFFLLTKPVKITISKQLAFKLAGAAGLFILSLAATGFLGRFQIFTADGALDSSIVGRLSIWQASWHMTMVHPLIGFGIGTFHLHYPAYRMAGDNSLGWMVHMDPLQTAVESGWIAAFILYAIFIIPFIFIYKHRSTLTRNHIAAAPLIVCFFIGMHMNYPMQVVPFLIILGTSLAAISPSSGDIRKIPVVTSCTLLAVLLCGIWTMTHTGMTLMLSEETQKSYRLMDQPRFDKAMQSCINDGDKDFPDCRVMAARFLTLAHDKDWQRIETLLDEAEAANPLSPEPDYIRAQRLMFLNPPQEEEALVLLKHSIELNPAYWPARRMAVEILMKRGDKTSARSLLDEGLIYRYARATVDDISRLRKKLQ